MFEKWALRSLDPLLALTVRTGIAALVLIGACFLSHRVYQIKDLTTQDLVALGASGLLAGVLGMFTYFSLLKTGQASKVVPLTAAYPLVTAILSLLVLREDISLMRLLGIIITILGLIILQRS